jgi:hypothetical protein
MSAVSPWSIFDHLALKTTAVWSKNALLILVRTQMLHVRFLASKIHLPSNDNLVIEAQYLLQLVAAPGNISN